MSQEQRKSLQIEEMHANLEGYILLAVSKSREETEMEIMSVNCFVPSRGKGSRCLSFLTMCQCCLSVGRCLKNRMAAGAGGGGGGRQACHGASM